MAELLSEKNRLRNQYFDTWQQAAHSSLTSHPGTLGALGHLGTQIISENEAAFLPNFSHGYVRIPRSQRSNDATAVIPTDLNEKLYLAPSMNRPLKGQRRSKLHTGEGLMMYGLSAFFECLDIAFGNKINPVQGLSDTVPALNMYTYRKSLVGTAHGGRPKIIFDAHAISEVSEQSQGQGLVGAIANHEYVHTIDLKEKELRPNFIAASELRAYYVAGIILGAVCPMPHTEDTSIMLEPFFEAEKARQDYNIPGKVLLDGTFEFKPEHTGLTVPGADPVSF